MQSRTADGKHTARFIILKKAPSDEAFERSFNFPGFYSTREAAQAALDRGTKPADVVYKIRQK